MCCTGHSSITRVDGLCVGQAAKLKEAQMATDRRKYDAWPDYYKVGREGQACVCVPP